MSGPEGRGEALATRAYVWERAETRVAPSGASRRRGGPASPTGMRVVSTAGNRSGGTASAATAPGKSSLR